MSRRRGAVLFGTVVLLLHFFLGEFILTHRQQAEVRGRGGKRRRRKGRSRWEETNVRCDKCFGAGKRGERQESGGRNGIRWADRTTGRQLQQRPLIPHHLSPVFQSDSDLEASHLVLLTQTPFHNLSQALHKLSFPPSLFSCRLFVFVASWHLR